MEQERRTDTRRRSREKQKKKRSPLFDVISGIVLIAAVCVFVFSLYQLVMMLAPYYTGGKEYDEIQDLAVEADADGTGFSVDFDDAGSIGKRYRREDEIGTPFCITYDFDSENDGCVTVRDRDTMEQIRIKIEELKAYIEEKTAF